MSQKLIHITDLYHPHGDPDDHYDLAQVFALGKTGDLEVMQVIIDDTKNEHLGSPAIGAVYQLNYLTNLNVHVTLGADTAKFVGKPELWKTAEKNEVWAAEKIIEILKTSVDKVYISIVGGCLDTAVALERDPDIFREKCAGIILNAGSSENNPETLEYNVGLGATEFSKLFQAPCPIYWNPCLRSARSFELQDMSGENATYYQFLQNDVFSEVSEKMVNFFLYMLKKEKDADYLKALEGTPDPEITGHFGKLYRNMWCTGSIFGAAGKSVTKEGAIVSAGDADEPVFYYRPIKVKCADDGRTSWEFTEKSTDRFICCVSDYDTYRAAMTKALVDILKRI